MISPSNQIHVLVVEDNSVIAMQLSMMLEEIGVGKVHSVQTVADAQMALEGEGFDLAILDLQLGNENGLIVAERCAADGIPVIFSTGFGDVFLPVTFASEQLLTKPYSMHDLKRAMSQLGAQSAPVARKR